MTMWHAQLTHRELIELFLGAPGFELGRVNSIDHLAYTETTDTVSAYWADQPTRYWTLPDLIIVPESGMQAMLTSVCAIPQAPSPITAICHILTAREARSYFGSRPTMKPDILPIVTTLAIAEALALSDGRITLRQVTPAICKRTMSYAWGRALASQAPAEFLRELPGRWLEAYASISGQHPSAAIERTFHSVVTALEIATNLSLGNHPSSDGAAMAEALYKNNRRDAAWAVLGKTLGGDVSLDRLAASTREERGAYLQQALRASINSDSKSEETLSATAAFIATQVGPGSLEHLELLYRSRGPSVLFWYALFASLQAPGAIMTGQNGLGIRVMRDISRIDTLLSRPSGDLAFQELKILERTGLETIARKLSHAGEVEIELIPLVTASFTYQSRAHRGRDEESQLPLMDDNYAPEPARSIKSKLTEQLAALTELVRTLPDGTSSHALGSYRKGRKK